MSNIMEKCEHGSPCSNYRIQTDEETDSQANALCRVQSHIPKHTVPLY